MAIYHLSAQVISRGKGQSAVASAAYRSGEQLHDERTGEDKFYRRDTQPDSMILAPELSPDWVQDRNRLWNEVEQAEKRKDSQLAKEINIALPIELDRDQQKELVRDYAQEQFVNRGMVADIAIHRDDPSNPHAHILLTTREITAEGFEQKNRDWNKRELLEEWREQWANHANNALEKAGVQEKISHLSHEARGLEQLPTVHLGHVASEMEKRGAESDRGNVNRERQEYNAAVIELEKYREEKRALEEKQQKAKPEPEKKETEKQQPVKQPAPDLFNTTEEIIDLKAADKILKKEADLSNIVERQKQLKEWEKRIDNNDQYSRWKDNTISEAAEHFGSIAHAKDQIKEAEKRIEKINWLNPLKIKENRATKEKAEQDIAFAKKQINVHDQKLNYHREKLKFQSKEEFSQVKMQHEKERPQQLQKNKKQRAAIDHEIKTLEKAQNALKNRFIRQTAALYPDRPEMRHMSFKTAQKVAELNKKYGQGKAVPIEAVEKAFKRSTNEIERLEKEISRIEKNSDRLQRVKQLLADYEKEQAIVERYENNPFLKGKMKVSKATKQEYEKAVEKRNSFKERLNKEGVSGREDFKKQLKQADKMKDRIPEFKGAIKSEGKGLGLLSTVLDGLGQAGKEMQRDRSNQKKKQKAKGNKFSKFRKYNPPGMGREL